MAIKLKFTQRQRKRTRHVIQETKVRVTVVTAGEFYSLFCVNFVPDILYRLTSSSVRSNLLRVPTLHCSGISLCQHVRQRAAVSRDARTSSTVMIEQSLFMQYTFSSQNGHSLYRSTCGEYRSIQPTRRVDNVRESI